MATGVEAGSVNASSQEGFEFSCDPCGRDDNSVAAKMFCCDCCENICAVCIDTHRRFPLMRAHQMTECSNELPVQLVNRRRTRELTDMCETHREMVIDTVCLDHQDVCCGTCVSVNHRNCKDVVYLPEAAKGVTDSKRYKNCSDILKNIKLNAESKKATHQNYKMRAQEKHDSYVADVSKHCNAAKQRIDTLESNTKSELRSTLDDYRQTGNTKIDKIDKVVTAADDLLAKLTATAVDNAPKQFVLMIKTDKLKTATNAIADDDEVDLSTDINHPVFRLNNKLQALLDLICGLEMFDDEQAATKSSDSGPLAKPSGTEKVTKPTHVGQFNVMIASDENIPSINGAVVLSDGNILISDGKNNKLKMLNASYKVIRHIELPGQPSGVCATGPDEVCVALLKVKYVQFVNVGVGMEKTRIIYVGEQCNGVGFGNGHVYVTCGTSYESPGKIRVYSRAGELHHTWEGNSTFSNTYAVPGSIAVSGDGTRIYVVAGDSIVAFNRQGELRTFNELNNCCSVCVDESGCVYAIAACDKSYNVVQLDCDGKPLLTLTKQDGIENPTSVCYDAGRKRLIVVMTPGGITYLNVYHV